MGVEQSGKKIITLQPVENRAGGYEVLIDGQTTGLKMVITDMTRADPKFHILLKKNVLHYLDLTPFDPGGHMPVEDRYFFRNDYFNDVDFQG